MKRCPQCNRTYTDDGLSFCLDDGSPLVGESAPSSSFDPGATIQYPQSRDTTSPQPTIAYGPGQAPPSSSTPPPFSSTPPPAWSPMPPMAPQKRSVWPWILGIGGVLVFMGIGVVILIVALASMSNNNNNNANSNANRIANRNANANENANSSVANANTRSTLSSFTDDFSAENWGTPPSQYGRLWYEDEEYHMHSNKGGYIVMYSPDKPEYHDENATVRITMRSVDGDSPDAGYGLLVHGEMKNGQLEDYGFLLYNGTDPKYKIIVHKAGAETKLADWTSSSAIRTGTTPNQIEVRIRDRRMDFYINGQFVTSATDSEGYLRGRVGLYSSDAGEVAFDDLEISK